MAHFNEFDRTDGRQLIPINGRGLFITDSLAVEFTDQNQRDLYPLVSAQNGQAAQQLFSGGNVWCIPIEAKGYLILAPGATYTFHEASEYQRFEFVPAHCQQTSFYLPVPPPTVNGIGFLGGDSTTD